MFSPHQLRFPKETENLRSPFQPACLDLPFQREGPLLRVGLPDLRFLFDQNQDRLLSDIELSSLCWGHRVWRTGTCNIAVWASDTGGALERSGVFDHHTAIGESYGADAAVTTTRVHIGRGSSASGKPSDHQQTYR